MELKYNQSIQNTTDTLQSKRVWGFEVIILTLSYYVGVLASLMLSVFLFTLVESNFWNMEALYNFLLSDTWLSIPIALILIWLYLNAGVFTLSYYVFKRQKRNLKSMGWNKASNLKKYLLGSLLGLGTACLVIMLHGLLTNAEFYSNLDVFSLEAWIIPVSITMVRSLALEILYRAATMNYLASRKGVVFAIVANSIFFTLVDIWVSPFSVIGLINIFLLHLICSLMFYLSDNIFFSSAFRAFWMIGQSQLFAYGYAGTDYYSADHLITVVLGESLIFDGLYVTTIVLFLLLGLCLYCLKRNNMWIKG